MYLELGGNITEPRDIDSGKLRKLNPAWFLAFAPPLSPSYLLGVTLTRQESTLMSRALAAYFRSAARGMLPVM